MTRVIPSYLAPLAAVLLMGAAAAAAAQTTVGGQVRPRWERRDPAVAGGADAATAMRVRAQVDAQLQGGVRAFAQLQDVRTWGEEHNTLADFRADNLDLHQGYADFHDVGRQPLDVRLGRQEVSWGGQRLLGAVGWTHQGRAFDAARVTWRPAPATVDLLAARLADATAGVPGNGSLLAGQAAVPALGGAEIYLLYNTMVGGTAQYTSGVRQAGRRAGWQYRLEGAWQTGQRGGADVTAFFLAGRVGRMWSGTQVTLWYDYLSGDDDPTDGTTRVFDTLFATNHKFYGTADEFLNIPVATAGRGLQDLAVKAQRNLSRDLALKGDAHAFWLAKGGGLGSAHLADELDVTAAYAYQPGTTLTAGASYVRTADAFAQIGRPADDVLYLFLMTDVRF